ncbi:integrase core domain-containing protein [Gemmobacter denitrificans]
MAAWRKDYNTERPHSRLGWPTPRVAPGEHRLTP